jgi:ankyrin repeat protein
MKHMVLSSVVGLAIVAGFIPQVDAALIHDAVKEDNWNEVNDHLADGVSVNAKNRFGYTPLIWAARYSRTNIVKKLIEVKANINAQNDRGETALICASINGRGTDSVKRLIEANADVNAKDNSGKTALMRAAEYGHRDSVKQLIEANADVNAKDKSGETALMRAANTNIVKQLLEHPDINIQIQNKWGETALDMAKERNRTATVNLIEEYLELSKEYLNQNFTKTKSARKV